MPFIVIEDFFKNYIMVFTKIYCFHKNKIKKHISMISEESCDTEDYIL